MIQVGLRALALSIDVIIDVGLWSRDERSALRQAAVDVGAATVVQFFDLELPEQRRGLDQRLSEAPPMLHVEDPWCTAGLVTWGHPGAWCRLTRVVLAHQALVAAGQTDASAAAKRVERRRTYESVRELVVAGWRRPAGGWRHRNSPRRKRQGLVRLTQPYVDACRRASRERSWKGAVMASVAWAGPRQSVESLAAEHGRDVLVAACRDLLVGRPVDPEIILGLGGPPARWAVHGGEPGPDYWLRVWALRGLLWVWDDAAGAVVLTALSDEAWRVREMAAKVAARHRVDAALETLVVLQQDPVERVRVVAGRAVRRLTTPGWR